MRESVPTIAASAVRKLLASLESLGLDDTPVRAKLPLPVETLGDPDARVPIATLHDLWEVALPIMARPDAALITAATYLPGEYGIVGFVAMNSATLAEGIGHVVRYSRLWTDAPSFQFSREGTLRLVYREPFARRPGLSRANEAGLAEFLHAARVLTQQQISPIEVRFSHEAPRDASAHERFFGSAVLFEQADDAMVFAPAALALPMPKADAMLGGYLRSVAEQSLAKRPARDPSLGERMREILAEALPNGPPSVEEVAKRLAMSDRTLRRRLEDEGTSFREMLDATRADLARSYVRDSRMPLSEVAFALGFSEPAAFHRAFKRWTGTTPSGLRRAPLR